MGEGIRETLIGMEAFISKYQLTGVNYERFVVWKQAFPDRTLPASNVRFDCCAGPFAS